MLLEAPTIKLLSAGEEHSQPVEKIDPEALKKEAAGDYAVGIALNDPDKRLEAIRKMEQAEEALRQVRPEK
ncbi:MAG TPA: hypothetical protein VFB03_02935 [Candidatus Saccharimonadales bacterium]|nr:hypothetical protein [Candidatus Saccharimonadales bacterium]